MACMAACTGTYENKNIPVRTVEFRFYGSRFYVFFDFFLSPFFW